MQDLQQDFAAAFHTKFNVEGGGGHSHTLMKDSSVTFDESHNSLLVIKACFP
jgi:hypothetical protein